MVNPSVGAKTDDSHATDVTSNAVSKMGEHLFNILTDIVLVSAN